MISPGGVPDGRVGALLVIDGPVLLLVQQPSFPETVPPDGRPEVLEKGLVVFAAVEHVLVPAQQPPAGCIP